MTVTAIHHDCVVCLTMERPDLSPPEAVKVVLMMLARDIPGDQIVRDLCFAHRRENDEHVKQWKREEPG